MDHGASDEIRRVWRQRKIPVVVRRGDGFSVHIKLPNPIDSFEWKTQANVWLKPTPRSTTPRWLPKSSGFEVPKAWFSGLVDKALNQFGRVYVIQPYREQEKCSPSCMNAVGHECNCSCMGQYHGAGGPGADWIEVSEAFATRWGEQRLACRLMIRNEGR